MTEKYTYSGLGGRVSSHETIVSTLGTCTQGFSWNDLGAQATMSYPVCVGSNTAGTARTLTLGYSKGLLTSVADQGRTYASSISYHPNTMLKAIAHGNGVTVTHGLDPNSMRRPASIATSGVTGTPGNWESGAYGYDGAGNIVGIGGVYYLYDGVSRLVHRHRPAPPACLPPPNPVCLNADDGDFFDFDAFGNVRSWMHWIHDQAWGELMPTDLATNRLTGAGYDSAGSVTSWNGTSTEWYPLNALRHVQGLGINETYGYTADGERLTAYDWLTSKYMITLRDLGGKVLRSFEVTPGSPATWTEKQDWIYRDGQLLASIDGGVEKHFHLDHLGSPRLVTSSSGQRLSYTEFHPFGWDAWSMAQDSGRMQLTGHERDVHVTTRPSDDLYYMHARYYNPNLGRFLSVDTGNAHPSTPQSWNRYAYGLNNPMRYVDPNGENAWDFVAGMGNGLASSLLLNNLRQDPANRDFANGQAVGDAAAVVVAVLETNIGMGLGGGAVAAEIETAGGATGAAVPAAVLGAGMIAHGVVSQGVAVSNLTKFAGGKTGHGEQRQAEAQAGDAHRQVGDPNRVMREGKQFIDRDTGNTVYVSGNRVVIYDSEGKLVSQFTNSRSNTSKRIEAGRWSPVTQSPSGPKE